MHHKHNISGKLIAGILLIIVGILLTLDNLEIIYIDDFIDLYWPLFMIVPGIFLFFKKPPSFIFGSTLVVFGIYFQLRELGIIHYPYTRLAFPLFLIFLGVSMIFFSRKNKHPHTTVDSEIIIDSRNHEQNRTTTEPADAD